MKLRKPCEHGLYDPHPALSAMAVGLYGPMGCPGGVFLPESMNVWYCTEHEAGQPTNDGPDSFHRCYEWWIGEMNPEAPLLTECRMVEGLLLLDDSDAARTEDRQLEQRIRDRQDVGLR